MTDRERPQRVVEATVDIDLVARMAVDLARIPGRAGSEIIRAEWLAGALRDVAGPGGPEMRIQRLGESRANILIGPAGGPTLAFAGHLDTSCSARTSRRARALMGREPCLRAQR